MTPKKDCPKEIIEKIIFYIESKFQAGKSTIMHKSVTGEKYISLCSGGVIDESSRPFVIANSWKKAADLFLCEFDKFSNGKSGKLYWRKYPEPVSSFCNGDQYMAFTARLLISDKPELKESELDSLDNVLEIASPA